MNFHDLVNDRALAERGFVDARDALAKHLAEKLPAHDPLQHLPDMLLAKDRACFASMCQLADAIERAAETRSGQIVLARADFEQLQQQIVAAAVAAATTEPGRSMRRSGLLALGAIALVAVGSALTVVLTPLQVALPPEIPMPARARDAIPLPMTMPSMSPNRAP